MSDTSSLEEMISFRDNVIQQRDAEGLNQLGTAFLSRQDLGAKKQLEEAILCFNSAAKILPADGTDSKRQIVYNNLGVSLIRLARLRPDDQRQQAFSDAVFAFDAALAASDRVEQPQQWASTQVRLGNALRHQAEVAVDADRQHLLERAVSAFRSALEEYHPDRQRDAWATTQNNLGVALREQALLVYEMRRIELLREAQDAYRAALTVLHPENAAGTWAATQHNLAIALRQEAVVHEGAPRARLHEQAMEVYRALLTVETRDQSPEAWGMIHLNLAMLYLQYVGALAGDPASTCQALREARESVIAATTVFSQADFPDNYRTGVALREQIDEVSEMMECVD